MDVGGNCLQLKVALGDERSCCKNRVDKIPDSEIEITGASVDSLASSVNKDQGFKETKQRVMQPLIEVESRETTTSSDNKLKVKNKVDLNRKVSKSRSLISYTMNKDKLFIKVEANIPFEKNSLGPDKPTYCVESCYKNICPTRKKKSPFHYPVANSQSPLPRQNSTLSSIQLKPNLESEYSQCENRTNEFCNCNSCCHNQTTNTKNKTLSCMDNSNIFKYKEDDMTTIEPRDINRCVNHPVPKMLNRVGRKRRSMGCFLCRTFRKINCRGVDNSKMNYMLKCPCDWDNESEYQEENRSSECDHPDCPKNCAESKLFLSRSSRAKGSRASYVADPWIKEKIVKKCPPPIRKRKLRRSPMRLQACSCQSRQRTGAPRRVIFCKSESTDSEPECDCESQSWEDTAPTILHVRLHKKPKVKPEQKMGNPLNPCESLIYINEDCCPTNCCCNPEEQKRPKKRKLFQFRRKKKDKGCGCCVKDDFIDQQTYTPQSATPMYHFHYPAKTKQKMYVKKESCTCLQAFDEDYCVNFIDIFNEFRRFTKKLLAQLQENELVVCCFLFGCLLYYIFGCLGLTGCSDQKRLYYIKDKRGLFF